MLEKYQGKSGQGSNEYPKGQIDCSPQKSSETKKIEISNRLKKSKRYLNGLLLRTCGIDIFVSFVLKIVQQITVQLVIYRYKLIC